MTNVQDKKIIITGAGSGIGRATALELAKSNTTVIAVGNKRKNIVKLANEIQSNGGVCYSYIVDLSDYSKIRNFSKKIIQKFKSIDWLINSAGVIEKEDATRDISMTFKVNTLSVIYLTRFLSPIINENGGIINISSIAGIWPSSISPAYSVSKTSVNRYSQITARAFASSPKKLSCFALCPGRTNTPMRQRIAGDARLYQGPEVIAKSIKNIIDSKSKFKNGDIFIVKNGRQRIYERLRD
jgi:short-subunit dehydrogenase